MEDINRKQLLTIDLSEDDIHYY